MTPEHDAVIKSMPLVKAAKLLNLPFSTVRPEIAFAARNHS